MGALHRVSKISPSYFGMILSDAIYVRDIVDPPGFIIGIKCFNNNTKE